MPTALRGHGRALGSVGGWHAHGSAWAWEGLGERWAGGRVACPRLAGGGVGGAGGGGGGGGRVACPRLCVGMGGPWGALGHGAGTNHAHAKPWACHPAVGMPPGASMAHRP